MDVRFIAAANESLDSRVSSGNFRHDLYYRLAEFTILVPPLRERPEDIVVLARRFQEEASVELRRPIRGISEEAVEVLKKRGWPGNVRELRNLIRQATLQATGPLIEANDVLQVGAKRSPSAPAPAPGPVSLGGSLKEISDTASAEAEKLAIVAALRASHGNKSKAAKFLQVDYKTLHLKIKRYRLDGDYSSAA
jgi:two-component system nitrogen regulation response regulator GlnG